MAAETSDQDGELTARSPSVEDLCDLCRRLNDLGARYVVIGGFAIRAAGLPRETIDIDLMIDSSLENEALVYRALESLPDRAVCELQPGEVRYHNVVRVADEITVDLMHSACGIDYTEASKHAVTKEIAGVSNPFASPRLLWRMKRPIGRPKDQGDLAFLAEYFAQRGETPPETLPPPKRAGASEQAPIDAARMPPP